MSEQSFMPDPDEVAVAQPYPEPEENQDPGDVQEGEVGPDDQVE